MNKVELIFKSSLAGVFIGLASCIYVTCVNTLDPLIGKVVGSCLFSVGLISVILLETFLYTGKIGYVNNKETIVNALIGLVFNLIAAFIVGLIYRGVVGIQSVMDSRLSKTWYRLIVDGMGCGTLIYLAVELYKKKQNIILIILPVMAFILAGFEHCIADAAYFGMCDLTWEGLLAIVLIIIGNSIGSLLIRFLQIGFQKIVSK